MEEVEAVNSMHFGESLPLEQSMTVSDVDWKNDPYHVIAEDEKQGSTLIEFSEEEQDRDICEQSWGLYFAQKSGAMGNISGTSRMRPQFSSPDQVIRLMPQTPPENVSYLNQSFSVPPKLPSNMNRRDISNAAKNNYSDHEMDVDDKNGNLPTLSIQDLMSPKNNDRNDVNHSLYEEINNLSPIQSNLLPQFENCKIDEMQENDIDNNSDELHEAIQSAIQRRRSLEPQIVINQNQNKSISNIQNIQNDIVTMTMSDIKQFHRFIQFFINPQQIESENIDDIKKKCKDLLEYYVSKLQNINSEEISCQTSWFNINTNQCTFYLLISCNEGNKKWSQIFLNIHESYPWIQSNQNEIVFSQFTPQKL